MSTTIEIKLRTAASANPTLQGYFGTSPFRWFPDQLQQNTPTPAAVCQRISRVPVSVIGKPIGNLARYRMQLTIYAQGADSQTQSAQISDAVIAFMNTFSATQGTQYANQLVGQGETIERPDAQLPPYFVQRMDFMIWNREDL